MSLEAIKTQLNREISWVFCRSDLGAVALGP